MGLGISLSQSSLSRGSPHIPATPKAQVQKQLGRGCVATAQSVAMDFQRRQLGPLSQWCSLYLKVPMLIPHWAVAKIQRKMTCKDTEKEAKVIAKLESYLPAWVLTAFPPSLAIKYWAYSSSHTEQTLIFQRERKPGDPIKWLHPVQSPGLMQHTPLSEIWIWLCVTS